MAAQPYWRVLFQGSANDSFVAVAALQFRTAIGGADVATGGAAIESSHFSGFVAANAFDSNSGTYWESGSGAFPEWVGYHFGSAVDIQEIAIQSNTGTTATISPRGGLVQSSPDGVTWTTVFAFAGQEDWVNTETRVFTDPARVVRASAAATGGTVTTSGSYTIHTFLSNSTLVVTAAGWFLLCCVAGGGGGGDGQDRCGGGGGGGGVVEQLVYLAIGSYTITVGAGGAGGIATVSAATNGSDTSGCGIKTKGGGHGNGFTSGSATKGGSGGGSRHGVDASGLGISQEGFKGGDTGTTVGGSSGSYCGCGGGGATQVGANADATGNGAGGKGGDGYVSAIDGNTYGGGGGGGEAWYGTGVAGVGGAGGSGGGGAGASANGGVGANGTAGTTNLGGGGGGGGRAGGNGAPGGSGRFVAQYLSAGPPARVLDGSIPLPLRVAGVMAHAQRGMDATLPLGLRASGTMTVKSHVAGIVSLALRVSGAIRAAEGLSAILRLPFSTTGVIKGKDQISGSARLPLGVAGRIGHKVKPCSLLMDVFRPVSVFGMGAHRYWRLSCTATIGSGPPAIAALRIGSEDEWFDPSSAVVTASSVNNGYVVAHLFDNDLATIWAPNTQVCWVQFDFGSSPVAAHRLGITPRDDVFSAAAQSMKDFALQWSDDGVAWTNDWSVTTQVDWTESLEKIYARSVYGDSVPEDIEWSVSNDIDDTYPYLIAPKQYAAQEIDPIGGTSSIGQIEIGVIDVPTVPGDQSTGWMTARVGDLLGRRCRLKRYINPTIGWVTIADGPAGAPKMDPSYAAYRWTIRDTREMERRLSVFKTGGYASVMPSGGIVSGFGQYTDDTGDHLLIDPVVPMTGQYQFNSVIDDGVEKQFGYVSFNPHFTALSTVVVDTDRLVVSDDAAHLADTIQIGPNQWAAPGVDILWRIPGTIPWNIARIVSSSFYRLETVNISSVQLGSTDGDWVKAVASVGLFFDDAIPAGFPIAPCDLEVIVRSRAPASEDFPVYVEGKLGDVLKSLYDGTLSTAPTYGGALYDPAGLNEPAVVGPQIQYDPVAFDPMIDQVCLRKTAPESDARTWAESALYGPSGWIPSMDSLLRISPRTRNSPAVVTGPVINDANSVPAPNWNLGSVFISAVEYTYPRYFAPTHPLPTTSLYTTSLDGLSTRQVTVTYDDEDADLRYGTQVQSFDASAFAAIGTPEGINLPGQLEVANGFAQTARFEVLQRYRAGVPAIALKVRRSLIPFLRSGDWTPYDISWIPGALGNRSASGAAQIISVKDDDCIWRTVSLDLVPALSEAPGYADSLVKLTDIVEPGYSDGLSLYDDVISPDHLYRFDLSAPLADERGGPALLNPGAGVIDASGFHGTIVKPLVAPLPASRSVFSLVIHVRIDSGYDWIPIFEEHPVLFSGAGFFIQMEYDTTAGVSSPGQSAVRMFAGSHDLSGTPIIDGQFGRIVMTRDAGKQVNVYVNGVLDAALSFLDSGDDAVFTPAATGVSILEDTGGIGGYTATVDEIILYDRALTADDVAALE